MRHFLYLILILTAFSSFQGCSEKDRYKTHLDRNDIFAYDSLMRHLAVELYREPDSVAVKCRVYLDSAGIDSLERAYASTVMAMASLVKGNVSLHDSLLAEARAQADRHDAKPLFREFYYRTLGVDANLFGDNDKAYDYTLTALGTANEAGLHLLAIEDETALGDFCQARGMLPEAATHMRRAIAMADSAGYSGQRSLHLSLAEVYSSMGNYDEADRYFRMHREAGRKYPPYTRFFYYSTLGNSLYYRGEYKEASDNFRLALHIADSTGDPFLCAMTKVNLGETLMLTGKTDSAAIYIGEGTRGFESIGVQDPTQTFYINSLKGALAMQQHDMAEARRLLTDASTDTTGMPPRYKALHMHRLADMYSAEGNYRRALEATIENHRIQQKLFDQNTRQYAAEIEYRYMQDTIVLNSRVQTARKQQEVQRLRSLIWGVVALAVVILLVFCIYAIYQRFRRRRMAEDMRASLLSMRLENTRNRLSPHFVFNMLNNTLSGTDGPDKEGVEKFVALIRRNLELAERPVITLGEEIDFVDIYVDFLRHSQGAVFEYHKSIAPDVDKRMLVPSMLIEIFVENAIKHGLRGFDGRRELWLNIGRRDNRTYITVENNGLMSSPATARGTGTGTRVVSQTIHVLNECNSLKIDMMQTIADRPATDGGKVYVVSISIPDGFDFSILSDKRIPGARSGR